MITVREHWDFTNLLLTRDRFEQLIAESTDPSVRAIYETQVVRCMGLAGEFEAAHNRLDDMEIDDLSVEAQAYHAIERGRVFNSSGDPEAAFERFEAAIELADQAGNTHLCADAHHMAAIAAPLAREPEIYSRALAYVSASEDAQVVRWLGPLTNNHGWTEFERGDYASALDAFQTGLAFREAVGDTNGAGISRWTVARTLRALNREEEAEPILLQLVQDRPTDGYVYEELAIIADARHDPQARDYATKALGLLTEADLPDGRYAVLTQIAGS